MTQCVKQLKLRNHPEYSLYVSGLRNVCSKILLEKHILAHLGKKLSSFKKVEERFITGFYC
jgi:hypothetical protein